MAVNEFTEPTADQDQLATWNRDIGGNIRQRSSFSAVPAGTDWAVIGCVLANTATAGDVESTLVPALEGLAEIISVNGDQVFGQVPAAVPAGYEVVVHVEGSMSGPMIGFNASHRMTNQVKPPVNEKIVVFICQTAAAVSSGNEATLEASVAGITGVTSAHHLISGTVPADMSVSEIQVTVHPRIDFIP